MKALLLAAGLALGFTSVQAAHHNFDLWMGGLSGVQEVPPALSEAGGGEVGPGIFYDDVSNMLDINVAYGLPGWSPLGGAFTAAHLHFGGVGVNGPVVVALQPIHVPSDPYSGLFQGSVALAEPYELSLLSGEIYLNIHSTMYPTGEIRGQLILVDVPEPPQCAAAIGFGLVGLIAYRRLKSFRA